MECNSGSVYLNVGDTVDIYLFQDTGSSLTLLGNAFGLPIFTMVKH